MCHMCTQKPQGKDDSNHTECHEAPSTGAELLELELAPEPSSTYEPMLGPASKQHVRSTSWQFTAAATQHL